VVEEDFIDELVWFLAEYSCAI